MPIYEFVCQECKNKFEKLLPISDGKGDVQCPKCNGIAQKVFSTFATFSRSSTGEPSFSSSSACSTCSTPSSCSTCG